MDQATLLWTLASTFFAGLALFLQKIVAEEGRNAALFAMISYGLAGILAVIVLLTLSDVPPEWKLISAFGIAAGTIHGLSNFTRIESLKYIDSVLYFPIHKVLGPLLVVIGGVVFFVEPLTILQYIGIALSLSVPLLLITSVERHRQKNLSLGLKLLIVSAVLSAASLLLSKQGVMYSSAVILFLVTSQIAGSAASAGILIKQRGFRYSSFLHADQRDIYLSALSGIFSFLSSLSLFMALSTGFVSIVYVIQAHYILIPIVLSVWWYKDHINLRKLSAVVVSFLAITLLAL
ncbi:hypothetical protein A3A39_01955 [Candidatus Kaiserbacteria bacterium RIFCSPLOWO2_01_FULL_54_13]|uniref:EamA domain-containing protein n=1 Tax=Candidatus Kaiserbacteria bacterium RIFCSPLOWO2_01_FULL_54_13 TaxID=1798512 RepID=A0A1F6F0J0_9BACT|nr:MAG: hypothetical protein A3A39_01955 [Candidatus Kaiserbacteria bacterium RIFCSPLOWO2_01_FULL_54_13]